VLTVSYGWEERGKQKTDGFAKRRVFCKPRKGEMSRQRGGEEVKKEPTSGVMGLLTGPH
jgi:hypothetical protein